MDLALSETGYKELKVSIPSEEVVSSASFLGETGDPLRLNIRIKSAEWLATT